MRFLAPWLLAYTLSRPLPPSPWFVPDADLVLPLYRPVYPVWNGWVRRKPDRQGDPLPLDPYARSQSILLLHPKLAEASAETQRQALYLHFDAYNRGTEWIETDLVNETNRDLARGRVLPYLPDAARRDALCIAGDEDAHALFTLDLRKLFAAGLTVPVPTVLPYSLVLDALTRDLARATPDQIPAVRLFWTIAIETLISGSLTKVVVDPTVNPLTREVLADHAADEERHRRYFTQLLAWTIPNLTASGREAFRQIFPPALSALLSPDPAWLAAAATSLNLPDPHSIAADLCSHPSLSPSRHAAAASPLATLRSLGALSSDPDFTAYHDADLT